MMSEANVQEMQPVDNLVYNVFVKKFNENIDLLEEQKDFYTSISFHSQMMDSD